MDYKIPIDKELLYELLVQTNESLQEVHFNELHKVFEVCMVKYYSKYNEYSEELFSYIIECVLTRKSHYNSHFPAYNFIYTLIRNQVGNYIKKHLQFDRDSLSSDLNLKSVSFEEDLESYSPFMNLLSRYESYLTGSIDYDFVRIPQSIAINFSAALLQNCKSCVKKSSDLIDKDVYYTLLLNLI